MPYPPEVESTQVPDLCLSVKELDQTVWRAWERKNRAVDAQATTKRLFLVKWSSIAVLLAIAGLWTYATRFQLEARAILTVSAAIIAFEAFRRHRYAFAAVFLGVIFLYNPAFPVFNFSGSWHLTLVLASVIPFAASLIWLNSDGVSDESWLYPNRGWGRMQTTKESR